jgi:hypothetical protein
MVEGSPGEVERQDLSFSDDVAFDQVFSMKENPWLRIVT